MASLREQLASRRAAIARDDGQTSADLASGGLLSPTQGAPAKKPKKKRAAPIVVEVPQRRTAPAWTLEVRAGAGVMVALWLAPEVAAQLAVEGGEAADDLHVTLVYLGKSDAVNEVDVATARAAVASVAAGAAPLEGVVSGIGRFVGDALDVIYASVDVPGISALREAVYDALVAAGLKPADSHGFDPHVTLAYVEPGSASPVDRVEKLALRFDALTFAAGGKRDDTPFAGANARAEGVTVPATLRLPEVRISATEFRLDEETCTVRGPVYPSFDPEPDRVYTVEEFLARVDSWGTYITEADVRKLSEDYMLRSQAVDRMHDGGALIGRVVECTVRAPDVEFPTATWYGSVRVDQAVVPDVRAGKLRGFSIEVLAGRERHTVTVRGTGEVPDLTGVTQQPFKPTYVKVEGQRVVTVDRMTSLRPLAVSLVDRPAIRQNWDAITRSDVVLRCALEEEPVPPTADPAPAEAPAPIADDEKPATRGWLRSLLTEAFASLRGDPKQLRADGTPPPALVAELPPSVAPVVTPPPVVARAAQETPMTQPAKKISTSTVEQAVALIARMQAGPVATSGVEKRDDAWSFGSLWEGQEVYTNVTAMVDLLAQIVYSRVGLWYGKPPETPEEVDACITALAADMSEFLGELRELLEVEGEEAAEALVAARSEMIVRACAQLSPEMLARTFPADGAPIVAGVEQRGGKKYSKATVERMKAARDYAKKAVDHLEAMCKEAEPDDDESEEKKAERAKAEKDKDKAEKKDCTACKGSGKVDGKECADCGGTGKVQPAEKAKRTAPPVEVPARPTETEKALADLRATVKQQEAEIARLANPSAPAVEPRTETPAPVVTPIDAQAKELAELRVQVEANQRRLTELAEQRRPSAQPANDGVNGRTPPAHIEDSRSPEQKYRDGLRGV